MPVTKLEFCTQSSLKPISGLIGVKFFCIISDTGHGMLDISLLPCLF